MITSLHRQWMNLDVVITQAKSGLPSPGLLAATQKEIGACALTFQLLGEQGFDNLLSRRLIGVFIMIEPVVLAYDADAEAALGAYELDTLSHAIASLRETLKEA